MKYTLIIKTPAYIKNVAGLPIYCNSTGKIKVITVFHKKFVTTAIDTAFPLTSRGKISEIKSHEIGPKPTWYPPIYTNRAVRMTVFWGVMPSAPQHVHDASRNPGERVKEEGGGRENKRREKRFRKEDEKEDTAKVDVLITLP